MLYLIGARTDHEIFRLIRKGFDPSVRAGFGAHFPSAPQLDIISPAAKNLIASLLAPTTVGVAIQ
jgi:hypothetical protein